VPSKPTVDESGEQTTELLDQLFLEVTSEERARNAKHARGAGDSSFDRLEGVISKVVDCTQFA